MIKQQAAFKIWSDRYSRIQLDAEQCSWAQMLCFKYTANQNLYLKFSACFFCDYFCDYRVKVNDRYILYIETLDDS